MFSRLSQTTFTLFRSKAMISTAMMFSNCAVEPIDISSFPLCSKGLSRIAFSSNFSSDRNPNSSNSNCCFCWSWTKAKKSLKASRRLEILHGLAPHSKSLIWCYNFWICALLLPECIVQSDEQVSFVVLCGWLRGARHSNVFRHSFVYECFRFPNAVWHPSSNQTTLLTRLHITRLKVNLEKSVDHNGRHERNRLAECTFSQFAQFTGPSTKLFTGIRETFQNVEV